MKGSTISKETLTQNIIMKHKDWFAKWNSTKERKCFCTINIVMTRYQQIWFLAQRSYQQWANTSRDNLSNRIPRWNRKMQVVSNKYKQRGKWHLRIANWHQRFFIHVITEPKSKTDYFIRNIMFIIFIHEDQS